MNRGKASPTEQMPEVENEIEEFQSVTRIKVSGTVFPGAIMMASLLNTQVAVDASVQVVRAFVRLREILATHKDLARKLEELEKKYDAQFRVVFDAIRQLMAPPEKPRRSIGFKVEEGGPVYRRRRRQRSTAERA